MKITLHSSVCNRKVLKIYQALLISYAHVLELLNVKYLLLKSMHPYKDKLYIFLKIKRETHID